MPVTRFYKGFRPRRGTKLLFDTNIWMALCWPQYNSSTNQIKSDMDTQAVSFLTECINSKYKILLPAMVVSELINRIYRKEFQSYNKRHPDVNIKEFRETNEGKDTLKDIAQVFSSQILKFQQKGYIQNVDDSFETISLLEAISGMTNLDFNDFIIVSICKAQEAVLVTNDSDFKAVQEDINIITTRATGL